MLPRPQKAWMRTGSLERKRNKIRRNRSAPLENPRHTPLASQGRGTNGHTSASPAYGSHRRRCVPEEDPLIEGKRNQNHRMPLGGDLRTTQVHNHPVVYRRLENTPRYRDVNASLSQTAQTARLDEKSGHKLTSRLLKRAERRGLGSVLRDIPECNTHSLAERMST